ncbi:hypothetical protein O3M35_011296 [Rhynocoris fuscipes]|uniref:NADH dehydrogenase subunit 4 n=1 Tax=Rhynocoris fuscipes TaxID=488301 RepID=A0AAW1D0W8_9HEMI
MDPPSVKTLLIDLLKLNLLSFLCLWVPLTIACNIRVPSLHTLFIAIPITITFFTVYVRLLLHTYYWITSKIYFYRHM